MDVHNYKLTPRGLKILKMDTLRLNDYLNQVMLENPVIEIEENLTGYTDEDLRARKAEWLETNDFEEGLSYLKVKGVNRHESHPETGRGTGLCNAQCQRR